MWPLHFVGFLQEPQILTVKSQERSSLSPEKVEEKIIVKYAQIILLTKVHFPRQKALLEPHPTGEGISLSLPNHQSQGEKPRHTYEGYSARTKTHLKTEISNNKIIKYFFSPMHYHYSNRLQ